MSSLSNDLSRLTARLAIEALALAKAEAKVFMIRMRPVWARARLALFMLLAAACLAFCSLIGGLMALIIGLVSLVGPWAAFGVVLLTGVLMSALLAWLSVRRFARAFRGVSVAAFIARRI